MTGEWPVLPMRVAGSGQHPGSVLPRKISADRIELLGIGLMQVIQFRFCREELIADLDEFLNAALQSGTIFDVLTPTLRDGHSSSLLSMKRWK